MSSSAALTLTTYLLQAVGELFLAAVLLRFWQVYQRGYLRHWGWSWLALAAAHLLAGIEGVAAPDLPPHPLHLILSAGALCATCWHLAWLGQGLLECAGRAGLPARGRALMLLALASFAGIVALTATPEVRLGLRAALAAAVLLATAPLVAQVRHHPSGFGSRLLAGALFVYGLEQTAVLLALLAGLAPLLPFIWAIDFLLQVGVGVGMTVWVLEEEQNTTRQSEDRFRSLVEMSSDAIFLADATGRITYSSPSIIRVLGYTPDDLQGQSGLDLVHPDDLPLARVVLRSTVDQPGTHVPFLLRARYRDGSYRWVEGYCNNHLDNPAVGAIVVNYRDVTESRAAEADRRASQQQLAAIASTMPHALYVFDIVEQRNVYSNREVWEELGYTQADLNRLGPGFMGQLLHPDDLARLPALLARWETAQDGEVLEVEYRMRTPGGTWRWFLGRDTVYRRSPDGRVRQIIGTAQDITARKHAEEERRSLEAQMLHAQKLESLGVLAGGVAHDFNNLLTGMLGYANLALLELPATSAAVPMLRAIESSAQRAADLTQQMLAYSGRGKFVVQPCRLDDLVREMAQLLGTVVSKKASLELHLEPATIQADATQIRQVVMNLLTNASDALGESAGRVRVRTGVLLADADALRSRFIPWELPPGAYAFVEVADDGVGMSEATLERIFDPFFTTKFTGRGLGLAAVLGIVQGHQGTIQVESVLGRGTLFRVLIPGCPPAVEVALPATPPTLTSRCHGALLVVDDEPSVRAYCRCVLEGAGYRVYAAADGRSGLARYIELRPDLVAILLDLTMPDMDGLDVLRELRRRDCTLPVLVMSGYSVSETALRCGSQRATAFLQKPFQPQRLLDLLAQLLPARG